MTRSQLFLSCEIIFDWVKNLERPPSSCPALLLRNHAEGPLGFVVSRVLPSCNVFLQVTGPLAANHKTTSPPFVLGVNELVSKKYVFCRLQISFSLQYITALFQKTEKNMQKGEEHNRRILDFKYLVCIHVLQLALLIKTIATVTVWSLYKCEVSAYVSDRVLKSYFFHFSGRS